MWHPRELLLARVWRCAWRCVWRRAWRCVWRRAWRFLSSLRGQQRTTSTHSVPHTTDTTSDITTDIYQPGRENVQSHLSTLLALEQDPRDEMLVDVAALPLPDDKAFAGSNVQAMQSLAAMFKRCNRWQHSPAACRPHATRHARRAPSASGCVRCCPARAGLHSWMQCSSNRWQHSPAACRPHDSARPSCKSEAQTHAHRTRGHARPVCMQRAWAYIDAPRRRPCWIRPLTGASFERFLAL